MAKLDVHRRGIRHVAVSAFVFSGHWVLLQQRARGKYHSGGQWANTCCSHPAWGETPKVCVRRRLMEELGIDVSLVELGELDYCAPVGGGLIENELVHLFAAEVDATTLEIAPDPDEVMATRWIGIEQLRDDARRQPALYTPWLRIYLDRAWPLIARAA